MAKNILIGITSVLAIAITISLLNGDMEVKNKKKLIITALILLIGFPGTIVALSLFIFQKPIEKLMDFLE